MGCLLTTVRWTLLVKANHCLSWLAVSHLTVAVRFWLVRLNGTSVQPAELWASLRAYKNCGDHLWWPLRKKKKTRKESKEQRDGHILHEIVNGGHCQRQTCVSFFLFWQGCKVWGTNLDGTFYAYFSGSKHFFVWQGTWYCNPLLFRWHTLFGKAKICHFGTEKISVAREGFIQIFNKQLHPSTWSWNLI